MSSTREVQNLTQDQKEDFREAFALFDQNGDGHISVKELGRLFYALGKSPSEEELEEMIKDVDVDGNGMLEEDEFLVLMARNMTQDPEQEMREAFAVFDQDGNGYVSANEFRTAMTTLSEMSHSEIDDMLKEADINGDGELDYNEFAIMMSSSQH